MRSRILCLLLVCTVMLAVGFAKEPKLSPDLKDKHYKNETVSVIIQYKRQPRNTHKSKIAAHGGTITHELPLVKAVAVTIPARHLKDLDDDDIAYITPDRSIRVHMDNAAPAVAAQYAWNLSLDGTGVGVAVIDSGIHQYDDLKNAAGKSRVVYQADLVGTGTDDGYGHGTHIAGIIGGNAKYSTCDKCDIAIRGIAPNVNLINLRVLDKNGAGTDSGVIAAINLAIQLKDQYNIRVLNLSLGRPVYESYTLDPLCQAVEKAWKAGIVVVVAAGNEGRNMYADGYGTITAPGNDPYVITVGAMNTRGTPDRHDDVMTSYSSKGPTAIDAVVKPDLMAPGNRIVSLQQGYLRSEFPQNRLAKSYYMETAGTALSDRYLILSGTSMATGVVSGGVALLLQQDPTLTPDQVKARLMKTAWKDLPPFTTVIVDWQAFVIQSDVFTVGAGYLDLQAALLGTDRASGSAMSPIAMYDSDTGNVYLTRDNSTVWGTSPDWTPNTVYGSRAFVDMNALWGSGANALWGSSYNALWGSSYNALWGSRANALWGSGACWGGNALWGSNYNALWGTGANALWGSGANALWGSSSSGTDTVTANSALIKGER